MKSVLIDDLKPPRSFLPRCLLVWVAVALLYGFYTVFIVPVTSPGADTLCECCGAADRLFYNRVPKCGSTTLITLIRRLSLLNNFRHVNSKVYDRKNVHPQEQAKIVQWVESIPAPCSLDRHVFFINFTRFGARPPLYINVIRDPVERIISSFFYRRMVVRQNKTRLKPPSAHWLNKKFEHCVLTPDPECTFLEGHNYSVLQLPYFCGQETRCQFLNEEYGLQKAKQNIEKYYTVVGTLEDMNLTLQVLEAALPRFFRGAYHLYHQLGVLNQNTQKECVGEEVKAILRGNLTAEYELYHFVRQRLHQQYQQMVTGDDQLLDY